ncbi:MAG: hypothetical protein M3042_02930 [Actinomycetota bacterium]|nr:hypothetical protein [Actinomycetota bacterium]
MPAQLTKAGGRHFELQNEQGDRDRERPVTERLEWAAKVAVACRYAQEVREILPESAF